MLLAERGLEGLSRNDFGAERPRLGGWGHPPITSPFNKGGKRGI